MFATTYHNYHMDVYEVEHRCMGTCMNLIQCIRLIIICTVEIIEILLMTLTVYPDKMKPLGSVKHTLINSHLAKE